MNDWIKTGIFGAVAGALIGAALLTRPRTKDPEAFKEEGKPLFPAFTDPLAVKSMEVTEYDEIKGRPRPFKVELKNGAWVIPSHHDYPADAAERLKKTAGQAIDLRKDSLRTDRASDHESLGVVDPLDQSAKGTKGRGKRIVLRDALGHVLADFILGDEIKDREMRYVRLPGQKWVYAVKTKAEFSARFSDWIETDFLKIETHEIRRLRFDLYRVEEKTGGVVPVDQFLVEKGEDYKWKIDGKDEANDAAVSDLTTALDKLAIVGVRPKPAGLTADLKVAKGAVLSFDTVVSLMERGFFLWLKARKQMVTYDVLQTMVEEQARRLKLPENVELEVASNDGEFDVITEKGVVYTLRFGEVAAGEGEDLSAGKEEAPKDPKKKEKKEPAKGTENRYVLITVRFDVKWVPPPKADPRPERAEPSDPDPARDWDSYRALLEKRQREDEEWEKRAEETMKQRKEEWDRKVKDGEKAALELNKRFGNWYYVISGESYAKLHVGRKELMKK